MQHVDSNGFNVPSALFGALLGVLLAYFLWLLQQWAQKRERRKNLATAMLVELWSLDWTLRKIYRDEEAATSYGTLPSHLFAEAHRVALEFPPETVFHVLLFRGLCQDIDAVRGRARDELEKARASTESQALPRFQQRNSQRHHNVRAKAGFALSVSSDLFDDLTKAGGIWRDPGPVKVTDGKALPEIPRSPFGHPDDAAD